MKTMTLMRVRVRVAAVLVVLLGLTASVCTASENWRRQEVDWQAGGGRQVRGIHYPEGAPVPTRVLRQARRMSMARDRIGIAAEPEEMLVESPPVDGFVPWVAVSVTRQRGAELDLEASVERSIRGNYPTGVNPQTDYIVGIFDTGASAHLLGYADAMRAGVYRGLVTSGMTAISGVTGSVDAFISYPLAVFMDGLHAVAPDTLLLDRSGMMGQSNVAVIVGQNPGTRPDLPTVLGTPLSVYYTTLIRTDRMTTITRDDTTFTAPEIRLYETGDPQAPRFSNVIPLELRPLGGLSVQYIPSLDMGLGGLFGGGGGWGLDDLFGGGGGGGALDFPPASPSVIIGNSAQSLFFVHSVDLYHGSKSALDKDRFMLDTGAQVTVVGSRMAARLRLNPADPEFEVEIRGVTGDTIMAPGYYIDTIEIPALGQWFRATNVPVILLDVSSPEGGTLDGIIGMNLFVDFNLIIRGGGLFLQDDPTLELERIEPALDLEIDAAL